MLYFIEGGRVKAARSSYSSVIFIFFIVFVALSFEISSVLLNTACFSSCLMTGEIGAVYFKFDSYFFPSYFISGSLTSYLSNLIFLFYLNRRSWFKTSLVYFSNRFLFLESPDITHDLYIWVCMLIGRTLWR